jgi:hypothetical protein
MATTRQGFLASWTSYNGSAIGAANKFQLMASLDVLEDTEFGDKWKTRVGGLAEWDGQGEATFDMADVGQAAICNALIATTPIVVPVTSVFTLYTAKTWTGTILITRAEVVAEVAGKVTLAVTFVGSGPPVIA